MDLYLIRHTCSQIEAGLCYGQLDAPLAPTHMSECAAVATRLPAVAALWTSPLTRCRVLAQVIGERIGVAPRIDERLSEMKFGEWEGRPWDAIDRTQSERWAEDYWNVAPPGGETYRELYERVGAVLTEIVKRNTSCVAVVTHAGPIRATLGHCLQFAPERYPELRLDYGGISLLRADDGVWHLEYLNG